MDEASFAGKDKMTETKQVVLSLAVVLGLSAAFGVIGYFVEHPEVAQTIGVILIYPGLALLGVGAWLGTLWLTVRTIRHAWRGKV
jgi:hypothetical protein